MTNESKRFFIFELALAAAGAACLLYAGLSDADVQDRPKCAPIADMRAALLKDYQEVELAGGLISEQAIMIIFGTPTG
jgi:hypothetical protein